MFALIRVLTYILNHVNIKIAKLGFGTAKLGYIYEQNRRSAGQSSLLVDPLNLEWNTIEATILQWNNIFSKLNSVSY